MRMIDHPLLDVREVPTFLDMLLRDQADVIRYVANLDTRLTVSEATEIAFASRKREIAIREMVRILRFESTSEN